ncbi:MAG: DNA mismatch repair protein MutS [Dehalococcoidia bacterium]|nr:DNA mismatch repair protein MutS [Dehalococcoidia bacterium]
MKETLTPIRAQYLNIKKQHPGAIVLFRLGDFYETFDEDARITSRVLGLVLTSRSMGKSIQVPMAGIPHHALDDYLGKLIRAGYRVSICEQLTKPGAAKGLVERDVIRVVTPGTIIEPGLLQAKSNNYLACVALGNKQAGLAYIDITTSEFACTQIPIEELRIELERLAPAEIVIPEETTLPELELSPSLNRIEPRWFDLDIAQNALLEHFNSSTLEGYGCAKLPHAIRAAGAALHYIETTHKQALTLLTRLSTYSTTAFMSIDGISRDNLEIFKGLASGTVQDSLLAVLDECKTAMGGRLLRRWLSQPLLQLHALHCRQEAVTYFFSDSLLRREITTLLEKVSDIERLINRIHNETVLPRELVALRHSLDIVPLMLRLIPSDAAWLTKGLEQQPDIALLIANAIEDNPASALGAGDVIRCGFSAEIDDLKIASHDARQYLARLERHERERTGIKNLKIGFNNIFGYYIEVSQSNIAQVPPEYIRKQTTAGGERYYTSELKEYESRIFHARERLEELETVLFRQICRQIAVSSEALLALANALAELDVFASLAETALRYGYVRPDLVNDPILDITDGRHPVVERALPTGQYVSNDIRLSAQETQIIILTGPNMAGKSTYLKQTAIIALMAQIGSYVPAKKAVIGLIDRIFTRIGARDDLSSGKSTFMVEMVETANILHNATPRSLLVLDEIGRGTSTYDGLSIAQAAVEYIHNAIAGARTIFATHYHELVALSAYLPRVRNFNVAVAEEHGEVVFMHKIVPGGVDKSYGIYVAQLAGLPSSVVKRASDILTDLENLSGKRQLPAPASGKLPNTAPQLSFFAPQANLVRELKSINIDTLSPLEAITKLYDLRKKADDTTPFEL